MIRGTVPLAEIFGDSTALRSQTQNRASFRVEPQSYGQVPDSTAHTVLPEPDRWIPARRCQQLQVLSPSSG